MPGFARIPEWFDHQNMGQTISFWFRNKIPSMSLFFSTKLVSNDFVFAMDQIPTLIINDYGYGLKLFIDMIDIMSTHHTYLYDMYLKWEAFYSMNNIILKNDWNHAEIICKHPMVEPLTEIGIHFFKQKNNMQDIQFTNPYEKY